MSFAVEMLPVAISLLLATATVLAALFAMTLGRFQIPFIDVIAAVSLPSSREPH